MYMGQVREERGSGMRGAWVRYYVYASDTREGDGSCTMSMGQAPCGLVHESSPWSTLETQTICFIVIIIFKFLKV